MKASSMGYEGGFVFGGYESAVWALHVQHDRCVNKNSMLLWHVSIDSVWLLQNCLQFQLMKEKSV